MRAIVGLLMLVAVLGTAKAKDRIEKSLSVPVLMEQYPYDGVVHDLDAGGFLAVKSGPGLSYDRIDKLYNKSRVYVVGRRGTGTRWSTWTRGPLTATYQARMFRSRRFGTCHIRGHVGPAGCIDVGSACSRDK
jgi:hypothetical protein